MIELPAISVLIATHQRRDALRRCLIALADQTIPHGRYETVVVIDRSSDGTQEMLDGFEAPYGLQSLAGDRHGRAGALNLALEHARGEVVVLLDDDMRPAAHMLEHHIRHHLDGSRRCVVGAAPIPPDLAETLAARFWALKFNEHLCKLSRPDHVLVGPDFYSGNVSMRTDVFRGLGGFDDSFVRYGHEDVELFIRMRQAGIEVAYDPNAIAWQGYDKDLLSLANSTIEAGMTAVSLVRRHPEVLEHLPLAGFRRTSVRRMVIRALLLALTRRFQATPRAVFAVGERLERAGLWRRRVFYEALLDFAYWVGAEPELAQTPDNPVLAPLLRDVRRGPVDLLLNR